MEWISVEDRLPDTGVEVMTLMRGVHMLAWRTKDTEWINDNDESEGINCVTHWMPLPEPPKESV